MITDDTTPEPEEFAEFEASAAAVLAASESAVRASDLATRATRLYLDALRQGQDSPALARLAEDARQLATATENRLETAKERFRHATAGVDRLEVAMRLVRTRGLREHLRQTRN